MGQGDKEVQTGMRRFVDVEVEKDAELQELCDGKNVVLLAFVSSYVPRRHNSTSSVRATISIRDEFGVEEALNQIQQGIDKAKTKKAYLLINSPGGLESSSFKIAQAIRDTFDDITVFVPHIAASGGTLLALTGNRIRMGIMSQLSSVDPQISYSNRGFVSVNSIMRAKEMLDQKFEKQPEQKISSLDKYMVEMLDPVIYEEVCGLLKASKAYLSIILQKTKYAQEEIDRISRILIFGLPTHNCVIDKNLAAEIGLKVVSDGDAAEWNLMKKWLAKYVNEETDHHFIRYCIPKTEKVAD